MIKRENLFKVLVSTSFYIALVRSTEMWFAYPTSENSLGLITFTPQKVMQMCLLANILLLTIFSFWKKFKYEQISLSSKVIVVSVILSVLLSSNFGLTARYFLAVSVVTLPVYCYLIQFGPMKLFKSFFSFLKVILVCNIIYIILFPNYGIMTGIHSGAFRGLFIHKNEFGATMAITALFFLISWWNIKRKRIEVSSLILGLTSAVLVFLSHSMTAILMMLVGLMSFIVFTQLFALKKIQHKYVLFFTYSVFLIISFSLFNVYTDEILISIGKDPTLTGRTGLWEVLYRVGLERPIFGHGIGLFSRPEMMYQFTESFGWAAKTSHNSVLDIFLGIGLVGLLATATYILNSIWKVLFINPDSKVWMTAILICLTISIVRLIGSFATSGGLIANSFEWLVLLIMILFLKSVRKSTVDN